MRQSIDAALTRRCAHVRRSGMLDGFAVALFMVANTAACLLASAPAFTARFSYVQRQRLFSSLIALASLAVLARDQLMHVVSDRISYVR